MDKKRRKKNNEITTNKTAPQEQTLSSILQLVNQQNQCGIISKKFRLLNTIGEGYFEYHKFDGLYIGIFNAQLKQNVIVNESYTKEVLEISFLLEGEQIINLTKSQKDLVFESQESYIVYLTETLGKITYSKQKKLKEVKIRMDTSFIKRHYLDKVNNLYSTYTLEKIDTNFAIPLCNKKQEIIIAILSDTRKGLLKRLFLEAKVLELMAIQLDTQKNKKTIPKDNLVKKIYQVQFIISSDLSVQHSIPQLARQVGINDYILKKEFKRIFNQTVFEYATSCRMKTAKKLLKDHKMPIYEISELVGFKNATHFSAAFKKNTNTTPNKYRKEHNLIF